jgi:UDP-N-acetylmuramoylalanine--D-glutamate ligase
MMTSSPSDKTSQNASSWRDKPLTVLGLSRSGVAVARYVAQRGGRVFLSDTAPASPRNEAWRQELDILGVTVEMGGHGGQCFSHADTVIVSPGIPLGSEVLEQLRLSGKTILSEVEFAWREVTEILLIGITGTNGKSTTTTLVSWILTQAGLDAPACGNIGIPVTDVINRPSGEALPDHLVVELSSFQLECSPTLKPAIAILTNFKPDHLDWHGSLEAYREAKLKLFTGVRSPRWSILPADDPIGPDAAQRTEGDVLWFSRHAASVQDKANKIYVNADNALVLELAGQPVISLLKVNELAIIGDHNVENVLVSAAAAYLSGIPAEQIAAACRNFQGLEHRLERLEPVRTVEAGDVLFYNDSKATNTDAAISALRAFKSRPVILIAGGYDKMTPLDEFVTEVQQHAKTVILIGAAKERFARALAEEGFDAVTFANSLQEAVAEALRISRGEPVLFSPACSSFDMFTNFEERGKVFKQAVQALRGQPAQTPVGG